MKKEEILAVVVRLFAIVLAIYAIGRLPSLAVYLHQNRAEDPGYLVLLAVSGLLVFVAAFLWKFPFIIARRLLSGARSEVSLESWTAEDALETGFILLGIYFAFGVLSDLLYWLFVWLLADNLDGQELALGAAQWANIFATFIELGIVMGLIFGAKGLVNIIRALRYAGRDN